MIVSRMSDKRLCVKNGKRKIGNGMREIKYEVVKRGTKLDMKRRKETK